MIKHGKSKDRVYSIYKGIRSRCDQGLKGYEGIKYSDKWKTFDGFFEDMGDIPFLNASLDRINSGLGYSKENCRWTTRKIQTLNRKLKRPKSGFSGVQKFANGFRGSFFANGIHHRKLFKTELEASNFYLNKYKEINKFLPPFFWVDGHLFKSFGRHS